MRIAPLASRLHGFGTTIFAEMSALAVETGAINLGQGFPDTDGPDAVKEAAIATFPGMRDRTVAISSGGRTFSFTGWKVGWVCAPPALVEACGRRSSSSRTSTVHRSRGASPSGSASTTANTRGSSPICVRSAISSSPA